MIFTREAASGTVLAGIGFAIAGYGLFTLQDAAVKWLVTDHAVWQVLFVRSVALTAILLLIGRRPAVEKAMRSRHKGAMLLRAPVILGAWICYYSAARHLGLAELTTLYYAAPIIVILLSIALLKEKVHATRWIAVGIGFVGVLVAANPGARPELMPTILVLIAATLWAWSNILVRQIMAHETTGNQMLFTNASFAVITAATMPWLWSPPDALGWSLMIGLGLLSGVGQYLLFEGFRLAPASAIAPCEYTSLVWAFLLGYAIWGDVPATTVFLGAGLIMLGSLVLVLTEHRRGRALAGAAPSPIESPVRPSIKPLDVIAEGASVEAAKPEDAAPARRDPASA